MLTTSDLRRLLTEHYEAAVALAELLDEADAAQWSPAPVPRPRDDEGGRSSGTVSDPTSAIVVDSRRLAVRESVENAGAALRSSTRTLRAARANVGKSLDEWTGHAE